MLTRSFTGCDILFRRYFARWYRPEDLAQRGYQASRPDVEVFAAAIGQSASKRSPLAEERARERVQRQLVRMIDAARGDWPSYIKVTEPVSLDGLHAFDEYWTPARIRRVVRESDPADFTNEYLVLCCELGAVIGEVFRQLAPHLEWKLDWPYWESAIWDDRTGSQVNVFDWGLKKFSSYGVHDGLRPKLLCCMESLGG